MSSVLYSGGTIVNTTFTTTVGTRAEVVAGIETALTSAGWSTISGGGTGTVLMKSATTASPKSNSIRVRLNDPGSGNCAEVRIEDDSGTYASQNFYLLPAAGKVFRIIACQYNFFCFTPQPSAAREFVCGGTLHIPEFLESVTTGSLGWMQGNAASDSDTSIRYTFRTRLGVYAAAFTGLAWCSQIRNNSVTNINDDTQAAGHLVMPASPAIVTTGCSGWTTVSSLARWCSGSGLAQPGQRTSGRG
jgi:hypothetical protein